MLKKNIENPRVEIDAIDSEILTLLNRRAEIALCVGEAKSSVETSLCDPRRECDVLARLCDENTGPLEEKSIENIFQRIIDESLSLQQKTFYRSAKVSEPTIEPISVITKSSRVAFLGERGTFSEEAALGILGDDCTTVSFPTFEDLFQAIDSGQADYILSPLENSLVGSVQRCYELLLRSDLSIVGETVLPISHFLIACSEAELETITTVESHPAALAQCERFFSAHPNISRVVADDTAGSVRRAVESGDISRAGIGGKRAAEIYGGKILRANIGDHAENFTRFALLAKDSVESKDGLKISLVVKLENKPGALHSALRPFVRRGIDLLKIESHPVKNAPSHFNFYLDLQAPTSESELTGAIEEISKLAVNVRFLGRYSRI